MYSTFKTLYNIIIKFVIGWTKKSSDWDSLIDEYFTIGDLIINNIFDAYNNLHFKVRFFSFF